MRVTVTLLCLSKAILTHHVINRFVEELAMRVALRNDGSGDGGGAPLNNPAAEPADSKRDGASRDGGGSGDAEAPAGASAAEITAAERILEVRARDRLFFLRRFKWRHTFATRHLNRPCGCSRSGGTDDAARQEDCLLSSFDKSLHRARAVSTLERTRRLRERRNEKYQLNKDRSESVASCEPW